MKVRCKTTRGLNANWYYQEITAGNMYEVLGEGDTYYEIISDKGRHLAYRKELFEVVEEEKMEVVKIREWKDLDGVKNDNYFLTVGGNGFISAYDLTKTKYYGEFKPKLDANLTIAWLKLFGFNIEFIKSPLEQVKEEINNILGKGLQGYNNAKSNTYVEGYHYAKYEMAKELLMLIERIEKDEPNA